MVLCQVFRVSAFGAARTIGKFAQITQFSVASRHLSSTSTLFSGMYGFYFLGISSDDIS